MTCGRERKHGLAPGVPAEPAPGGSLAEQRAAYQVLQHHKRRRGVRSGSGLTAPSHVVAWANNAATAPTAPPSTAASGRGAAGTPASEQTPRPHPSVKRESTPPCGALVPGQAESKPATPCASVQAPKSHLSHDGRESAQPTGQDSVHDPSLAPWAVLLQQLRCSVASLPPPRAATTAAVGHLRQCQRVQWPRSAKNGPGPRCGSRSSPTQGRWPCLLPLSSPDRPWRSIPGSRRGARALWTGRWQAVRPAGATRPAARAFKGKRPGDFRRPLLARPRPAQRRSFSSSSSPSRTAAVGSRSPWRCVCRCRTPRSRARSTPGASRSW